jgi:acyl-CoA thioesterase FadM
MTLNPKFLYFSPIPAGAAGKSFLAEQVDHAIIAMGGRAPLGGDCVLELLNPLVDETTLRVELWVNDLDDFTCTYGFLVSGENGRTPYARGERSVVSLDPVSHRPSKWSPEFRSVHTELLKDLPAYA